MASAHGDRIALCDPRTGDPAGEIACTPVADVPGVVARARIAGAAWSARPLDERKRGVERLRDAFMARANDVADVLIAEIGKPSGEAWTSEIVTTGELFAHWLEVIDDELAPVPVPLNPVNYPFKSVELRPEPVGVVALIMPWNYPINLPLRTIVPALLAGNAVVFKPSEHSARCGALLGEIFASALPADLVGVVQGGPEQGAALVDGRPDKIVFTGSVAGGRQVAQRAAGHLIPCSMELGSKDPAVVLYDAKIDRAVEGILWGAFHNGGQDCASVERCYVDQRIYDVFVEKLVARASALRVGQDVGPLINAEAVARVQAQVTEAVAGGAAVRCGGAPTGVGFHYPATVLTGVTHAMRVMTEETFGPLLPVIPFATEDEAVTLANSSNYGLCASVWTRDVKRGEALLSRISSGVAFVNNCCFTGPMGGAAWGGKKESGFGVTGSRWGLGGLVQPRTVCIDRSFQAREMWWYPYTDSLTTMARGLVELSRSGGAKVSGARMAVSGLLGRWNT